jgi:hypothetical protein
MQILLPVCEYLAVLIFIFQLVVTGTDTANFQSEMKKTTKEGPSMKQHLAQRLGYVGAGTGLALFAIFGLMPGAYLGGLLGLNMANSLFGMDMLPTLLHRVLTALGMLAGVIMAGFMFTVGGACLGWLAGLGIEAVGRLGKEPAAEEVHKT